ITLIAAAVAVVLFLLREPILGAAGSYLVRADAPQSADLVLVLAGDGRGNRILTAAELVRKGFVPKVLVSGPDGVYGAYECDLAIPFAVKAGYPESYFIHMENHARSTREEAVASGEVLHKMGVHKILLVTNDYHTRRAGDMYRQAMPDIQVTVIAAPDTYFSAHGWWQNREGQKTALYEWMKTIAGWANI
ncbi:MAG: YdcF family protein, partial [Acidobacteriota bacterium]